MSTLWSSPTALDTHSRRFDLLLGLRFYLVVGFAAVLATTLRLTASGKTMRTGRTGRTGPPARAGRARPRVAPSSTSDPLAGRRLGVSPLLEAASAALALGLTATSALAGHAAVGDLVPVAVAATIAHLLAMSLWLGGLALVAVSLTSPGRAGDLAVVLPRFSRLAFGCVCVMVATGAYLAWREVASIGALTGTEYGRLLLVKLAGVATLVGIGNLGRLWVQRHLPIEPSRRQPFLEAVDAAGGDHRPAGRSSPPEPFSSSEVGRLRRGVVAEVVIGFTVLSLTSALVVILPARQESATAHATAGAGSMHATIASPTSSGAPTP